MERDLPMVSRDQMPDHTNMPPEEFFSLSLIEIIGFYDPHICAMHVALSHYPNTASWLSECHVLFCFTSGTGTGFCTDSAKDGDPEKF